MKLLTIIFCFVLIITSSAVYAQDEVAMADQLRSSGKIYVVIAVMLTILLGLVLYVVRLDRKISKLEKNK